MDWRAWLPRRNFASLSRAPERLRHAFSTGIRTPLCIQPVKTTLAFRKQVRRLCNKTCNCVGNNTNLVPSKKICCCVIIEQVAQFLVSHITILYFLLNLSLQSSSRLLLASVMGKHFILWMWLQEGPIDKSDNYAPLSVLFTVFAWGVCVLIFIIS